MARTMFTVLVLLSFLTGCGNGPVSPGPGVDGQADIDEADAQEDAGPDVRSCEDWENEAGPIPENFRFELGEDEIGRNLKLSMLTRWRTGPNAQHVYACGIEQIREWPEESSKRLFSAYQRHPHNMRQDRWDLADHLGGLIVAPATDLIISIALEPIDETYSEDGEQARRMEINIRHAAIIGLEALIIENVDAEDAREGLIRIVLEHEEDGIKSRAAGRLKVLGMTKSEFANIVEGTDSEWLLEEY